MYLLQRLTGVGGVYGGGSNKGSLARELTNVRDMLLKKVFLFDPEKRGEVDKLLSDALFTV